MSESDPLVGIDMVHCLQQYLTRFEYYTDKDVAEKVKNLFDM